MAANDGVSFLEWKEEFVSQERGSRIVHYILKDSCGESILAVIGTERSLRHMVYVVADEFLTYSGTDNPIQAGCKWRSRREVVDWLTSMLAKQHQSDSPGAEAADHSGYLGLLSAQASSLANKLDHRVRNLKQSYSDIVWLGAPWICGKQLKHYPAFCRNGITIAAQSFVFVMAKEENSYVAYLEDMYEDRKGQKKVKVRWFHHSQEVKGTVRVRNIHPKEVYITPYTQVISVECVDGPAIVLTREHFEKCVASFPDNLLSKVHLCFRLFKSYKVKPFDLSKLRGYFDQPVISCLESNTFPNSDSICHGVAGNGINVFWSGENLGKGTKRKRSSGDQESFLTDDTGVKRIRRKIISSNTNDTSNKDLHCQRIHTLFFKVNDKIELLCQDSGIRGCWFRCSILEIFRKQMKVQYCEVDDQDGCGQLEEWVPAFRLASADKLGMRCLGRPTIRPCPLTSDCMDTEFIVGSAVDAWWSDGWWEGVLTATMDDGLDNLQVYVPGENLFLNVPKKDVRVSRDWVGGKWVDVKQKVDILSVIGQKTKVPAEDSKTDDDFVSATKVAENVSNEADMPVPTLSNDHIEQVPSPKKDDGAENESKEVDMPDPASSNGHIEQASFPKKANLADGDRVCGDDDDQNVRNGTNIDWRKGKSGAVEVSDEATELKEVHGGDDRAVRNIDQNVRNGTNIDWRKGKSGAVEVSDEATELKEVHGSDDRAVTVQN